MVAQYQIRGELKAKIYERGLTIAGVARAAGLSYSCLSAALNGRAAPSLRVIAAVSKVLGERQGELFSDEESEGLGPQT